MDNIQLQPYIKNSPISILNEKELQIFLLKFGSLLFILNNKNINPTFLFLTVVKNEPLQQIFKELSGVPTLIEILKYILMSYPNLIKSKIVKENTIRILKNKKIRENKKLKKRNKIKKSSKTLKNKRIKYVNKRKSKKTV
jgi:hypothetical protein